jgi:hypothetical protein
VWADTVTLRVGGQLVGVRTDTDATAARIRTLFASWLDPDVSVKGEKGEPVPWAFSLRLDADRDTRPDAARSGRGPRAVPQLRIGRSLLTRSRRPDDVVNALDHVLGGVHARQDETRRWLGLRTFVVGDRAVLVDAAPPALTADPGLARSGIAELPPWSVAVDGDAVLVPPPLTASADPVEEGGRSFALVGLVGLDSCSHAADIGTSEHDAIHHSTNPGALLARFAARHPSNEWFHTVERLVADGRVHVSTDRAVAAERIRRLLVADGPTG